MKTNWLNVMVLLIGLFPGVSIALDSSNEVGKPVRTSSYLEFSYGLEYNGVPLVGYEFGNQLNNTEYNFNPRRIRTIDRASVTLNLEGSKGFFLIEPIQSYGAFGVHIRNTENHLLSLVYQTADNVFRPNRAPGYENTGVRGLTELLGIRSTHYKDKYQLDLQFYADVLKGNGTRGSLELSRFDQLANWRVDTYAKLEYNSSQYNNYYVGVTPDQQSELAPVYKADRAIIPGLGFGVSRELRDNWEFKVRYDHQWLPESMVDSPLVKGRSSHILSAGFSYLLR